FAAVEGPCAQAGATAAWSLPQSPLAAGATKPDRCHSSRAGIARGQRRDLYRGRSITADTCRDCRGLARRRRAKRRFVAGTAAVHLAWRRRARTHGRMAAPRREDDGRPGEASEWGMEAYVRHARGPCGFGPRQRVFDYELNLLRSPVLTNRNDRGATSSDDGDDGNDGDADGSNNAPLHEHCSHLRWRSVRLEPRRRQMLPQEPNRRHKVPPSRTTACSPPSGNALADNLQRLFWFRS